MEGSPRLHAQVEEVRKRQDMESQRVIREVEEANARGVREGEERLEALYREQEEEMASLVLDWQRREEQMTWQGREEGGIVDEAQQGGNMESGIVPLEIGQINDTRSPSQAIIRAAAEAASGVGGQEAEAGGLGEGDGVEDEGERERRWFEGTLAPLIIVALLFRIIFI